jgi:heme/copper-type cytochrome/quinol oxidase subunit 2
MDGHPYQALNPAQVAHTFTIPALHLNVPIPGDGTPGAAFVTVTFTFRTGAAGIYMWQCFDPCGEGPAGYSGSMGTMGDMMGYLIIQG